MKIKQLIVAALITLFATAATATDYYVTQAGAGGRDGLAIGTAWNTDDFNSSANWDSSENATKIDPGDTVYFSGTITNTGLWPQESGSSGNPIILDGLESGVYDAHNDTGSAAVMSGSFFDAYEENYITIRDFKFTNQNSIYRAPYYHSTFITSCRGTSIDDTCKTSNITVANSHFTGEHIYAPSISLGFVTDWTVENNYYRGDGECTIGAVYHFGSREDFVGVRPGGARGKLINNHVIDSFHLFYHAQSMDRDTNNIMDIPPSGSYARDPEVHAAGIEVAYNLFDGWCEEGISFDDADSSNQFPVLEMDTVSEIDTNDNYIYLDNGGGEWTAETTDIYSGLYLANTEESQARYGKIALIEDQYQNRFTVASGDVSKFSVGDQVSVTLMQKEIWVHHNRIVLDEGAEQGWGGIWVEGNWVDGLIENNYIAPNSFECTKIMLQSGHDMYVSQFSVTGKGTHTTTAFNLARYNRTESLQASTWDANIGSPGLTWTFVYNNSFIDNILWKNEDSCNGLNITKAYAYYTDTNVYDGTDDTIDINISASHGGGSMSPDPTTGNPAVIYSLAHIGPNVLATEVSGVGIIIEMTETISGCSPGGACGFYITDSSGSVTVTVTSVVGEIIQAGLSRSLASNPFLYYNDSGNIVDSDSNPMYTWSIAGHDLSTEYVDVGVPIAPPPFDYGRMLRR